MKYILNKIENQICTLTINRPDQYNALNIDVLRELDEKLDWIKFETDARAVILTGIGHKAFIAGADIGAMQKMNTIKAKEFSKIGQEITIKIEEFNIPIIAAVNGFALGGGCEFALACHIRYASENAIFGQPEVTLGLIAGWGATYRLPKIIGQSRAMKMLLSGEIINANEAKKIGLIDAIINQKNLIKESIKFLKKIINNSPIAIANTIKAVNSNSQDIINHLENEKKLFKKTFLSEDSKEGINAFLKKRQAKFKGE